MASVELVLPHHQYRIDIEPGLLAQLGPKVRNVAPHGRAALIADEAVFALHGSKAKQSLEAAGYDVLVATIPGGEKHKHLDTVRGLYDKLVDARMERKSPIIALGGGVVGDMVGFVASSYLRGVPFVQCPTTLLSMVDASVGGKVGVNLPQGKNLIGAFYQPMHVVIDTKTLETLPMRELRCGLAECVKHGVIRDADRFAWLETNLERIMQLEQAALVELVQWNVQIKATVVMADEKETGERAHLNFGHTFAHAIEAISGYGHYEHGEAVSLGMIAATELAVAQKRCDAALLTRLRALLERVSLPIKASDLPPVDELMNAMLLDKKVADGKLRLVLPDHLGAVSVVKDVPSDVVTEAWQSVRG